MDTEQLKEIVVNLFLTKLGPTADVEHILQDEYSVQKAMEYYSEYGDFSLLYIPGDGADGFDLIHIGGNVHDNVSVFPPAKLEG